MIKTILLCTDGSPYGDVACEYAIHLAGALKARLTGLHVLDARMLEGPLLADISGAIGAQPYANHLRQFRDLMQEKGESIIGAFADRCRKAGIKVEGLIRMGHPPKVILEEEVHAELVVLGQKGEHADWIGDMPGSIVERVVRHSVKPCLVTPDAFRPIRRILAAYDGSAHASEALQQAAELALALGIELVVLTVAEGDDRTRAEETSDDARDLVGAHDCQALYLVAAGPAGQTIMDTARDEACSLIVVGAYGHSRIREMVLGSTTTQIITRSTLPVMLVR